MKFHKNKYYRVKELIANNGKRVFKVQSCENLLDLLIGNWKEYVLDNDSLPEAILQIESIHKWKLKSERIVHKENKDAD